MWLNMFGSNLAIEIHRLVESGQLLGIAMLHSVVHGIQVAYPTGSAAFCGIAAKQADIVGYHAGEGIVCVEG